ncbi:unnamed protein product [Arctogadus glacialis]
MLKNNEVTIFNKIKYLNLNEIENMTKHQNSLKTYTLLTYLMCSTAVLHNVTFRWKCLVKTFYNRVPIVQNVVLMHRQITVTAEKVFGQAVMTSNHCPFCVTVVTGLIQCPLC